MMILISVIIFLSVSILGVFQVCFAKEFFSKMISFFYFTINFITFLLIYFLFSNKFAFIINMIFPLIILNMVLILLFIKSINNGR